MYMLVGMCMHVYVRAWPSTTTCMYVYVYPCVCVCVYLPTTTCLLLHTPSYTLPIYTYLPTYYPSTASIATPYSPKV